MRKLTPEQIALRERRRQAFGEFVAQSEPALIAFASLLQVERPEMIVSAPEKFLPILENILKAEDVEVLSPSDRNWLHTRLTYFCGQLWICRRKGRWLLDEDPLSPSFLHYVVGVFAEGTPQGRVLDPAEWVARFLAQPSGRSLVMLMEATEGDLLG